VLQAGEVPKGLRDTALKALVIQRDSGDCPILVAGNSFPFAAVITLPKLGEVGILRELCEELEEGRSSPALCRNWCRTPRRCAAQGQGQWKLCGV